MKRILSLFEKRPYKLRNFEGIRFIFTDNRKLNITLNNKRVFCEFGRMFESIYKVITDYDFKRLREFLRIDSRFISLLCLLDYLTEQSFIMHDFVFSQSNSFEYKDEQSYPLDRYILYVVSNIHFCCAMLIENKDLLNLSVHKYNNKNYYEQIYTDRWFEKFEKCKNYSEALLFHGTSRKFRVYITINNDPELFKL